jgi:hypothetical protein
MWDRSARSAASALAREKAIRAVSLGSSVSVVGRAAARPGTGDKAGSHHPGFGTSVPSASVELGSTTTRQSATRAQMLKAVASGPNVAATRGKSVVENHQRLGDGHGD